MSAVPVKVDEPASGLRRLLRTAIWLAGIGIVVLVLQGFGINIFGWVDSLIEQMQKVSRVALVGAMLAQVLNLTFGGLAYVAIWRAAYPDSKSIPIGRIVACSMVGIALNGVLPLNLGSVTMLFMFLAVLPGATVPGMASGFGVDQIFYAVMGAFTYTYLFITISGALNEAIGGLRTHLLGLVIVAIIAVVAIVLLIKLLRQRLVPELHKLKQGAAVLRTPRVYIFSVLLLQLIAYFFQNAVVGFFMWGYGIPVSLHAIILNDAANSLATLTAVTPGGVGVTQTLTTLALADVADPKVVAAYSLTQQLVMTAWSITLAIIAVAIFFGFRGGRAIVTNAVASARSEVGEKRAVKKAEKAAEKHTARPSSPPNSTPPTDS